MGWNALELNGVASQTLIKNYFLNEPHLIVRSNHASACFRSFLTWFRVFRRERAWCCRSKSSIATFCDCHVRYISVAGLRCSCALRVFVSIAADIQFNSTVHFNTTWVMNRFKKLMNATIPALITAYSVSRLRAADS